LYGENPYGIFFDINGNLYGENPYGIPFKINGNWSGWRALGQFPNGILKEFLSKSTEIGLEIILMEFLSKSMEIGLESSWSISQWNP